MNDISNKNKEKKEEIPDPLTSREMDLISFISENPHRTISQIAKELQADYKNIHRICNNLEKKNIFLLTPEKRKRKRGIPVKVSLNIYQNDEDGEYIFLNILKNNGGRMEEEQLIREAYRDQDLLKDSFGKEKISTLFTLFSHGKNIRREIVLTKEGKQFLKKISRKKILKETIKEKTNGKN